MPTHRKRLTLGLVVALALVLVLLLLKALDRRATLVVRLPVENATLTVEGTSIPGPSLQRRYTSAPLERGREYTYDVVAAWTPNAYTTITRTKTVSVQAGQTVTVDLTLRDPGRRDDIRILYVPTPPEVADLMCRMAQIRPDDVVFDLGCGDGRLVLLAVEKYGASKGVGIDIDPQRIQECQAAARKSPVQDKLTFRQEDVFAVKDLHTASVVLLYMSEELNRQLRPILERELKPGARIVSHRFSLGDWLPDETRMVHVVDGPDFEYDIPVRRWTVGAKP
jgi:uncharacterized protein (TIGR03000 family)